MPRLLEVARFTKDGDQQPRLSIDWGNAALLTALFTVVTTLITSCGTVVNTYIQQKLTQPVEAMKLDKDLEKTKVNLRQYDAPIQTAEKEQIKLEADLIKSALSGNDPKRNAQMLRFLALSGLVRDTKGNIANLRDDQIPLWPKETVAKLPPNAKK